MRPIAFIRQMIAAGVDLETALLAAEKFEDQAEQERQAVVADLLDRLARDVRAEARKAKDRDRKRGNPRNSVESEEIVETLSEGSQGSLSPTPPNLPNPPNLSQVPPIVPQKSARKASVSAAFEQFWAAYPRKVAKGAAERAFPKALAAAGLETLITAATLMGRVAEDAKFIPHAASWLNDKRWLDTHDAPKGGFSATVIDAGAVAKRREENRRMYEDAQ